MKAAKHNTGRFRRFCKWAGTALTILLVSIWIASGWGGVSFAVPEKGSSQIWGGKFLFSWFAMHAETGSPTKPRWVADFSMGYQGMLGGFLYNKGNSSIDGLQKTLIVVPLWFVVLLPGLPTVFAWRHDLTAKRRFHLKCPHCAFNVSGLAPDAVCPECGKAR